MKKTCKYTSSERDKENIDLPFNREERLLTERVVREGQSI